MFKICLICKKKFFKSHNRSLKNWRKAKYCSSKCFGITQIGNIPWNKNLHIQTNTGRTHFKKGFTPWNRGIKRPEISGKNHPNFKGGWRKSDGHFVTFFPSHPFATKKGYMYHSRLIAEKCLGRYLTRKEEIHHINEKPNDDRPENLYLFSSHKEHQIFHRLKNRPPLKSNLISILQ